jgi:predicted MPP superfamily phosphohydrolase
MKNSPKITRRDFLKLTQFCIRQFIAAGLAGYLYGTKMEVNWIEITHISLKLPRLDPVFHGMRMVQVSDFHIGHGMDKEHLDSILGLALAEAPDCFVLTGDFVDKYPRRTRIAENIAVVAESFRPLSMLCPTFAVLGNHDHKASGPGVERALTSAGVVVLRNSVTAFERGGRQVHIAGVDDVREKKDQFDKVLGQLPENEAAILLVHEPDFADTSAATGRFDLQISGHSHGGQVSIPLLGPPYLPELGQKYPQGLYQVGDMLLYTNRGIGVTTINLRFNCRPEITVFTLESKT